MLCGLILPAATALGHEAHKTPAAREESRSVEGKPDQAIHKVLAEYRAAFEARNTDKLAEVVDKDLLVLEGTAKNVGWADYRDSHIGPEMKEWESLSYADPVAVDWQIEGDLGWAAVQSTVTIVSGGKPMTIDAAETFVLRRSAGRWLIRHIHWSGKRRPESKPSEAK